MFLFLPLKRRLPIWCLAADPVSDFRPIVQGRIIVAASTLDLETIFKRSAPFTIWAFSGHVPAAPAFLGCRYGRQIAHVVALFVVEAHVFSPFWSIKQSGLR